MEMYLAGVSVRRVEDITEALWGMKVNAGFNCFKSHEFGFMAPGGNLINGEQISLEMSKLLCETYLHTKILLHVETKIHTRLILFFQVKGEVHSFLKY